MPADRFSPLALASSTTNTVIPTLLNRLAVPVHAVIARSSRLPRTKARPSFISRPRCRSGARSGRGSRDRIDPTQTADHR